MVLAITIKWRVMQPFYLFPFLARDRENTITSAPSRIVLVLNPFPSAHPTIINPNRIKEFTVEVSWCRPAPGHMEKDKVLTVLIATHKSQSTLHGNPCQYTEISFVCREECGETMPWLLTAITNLQGVRTISFWRTICWHTITSSKHIRGGDKYRHWPIVLALLLLAEYPRDMHWRIRSGVIPPPSSGAKLFRF